MVQPFLRYIQNSKIVKAFYLRLLLTFSSFSLEEGIEYK